MSLEKRVEALEAAARPDEGWSLSDFRADVSEVIGDKRDLIRALERIGSISEQKVLLDQVIKAQSQEVDRLIQDAQRRDEASRAFTSIMDWWDQNYRIIVDAKESLALNKQIVDAANNATTSIDASARSARQASENFERATAQKMRDFGNTFEAAKRDLANTATTASRNLADSEKKVAAAVEAAKKAATEAAAAEIRKTDGNLAEMKRIQDRVNAAVNAAAQTLTNEVKKVFVNPPEGYKTLGDVKARVEEAKKAARKAAKLKALKEEWAREAGVAAPPAPMGTAKGVETMFRNAFRTEMELLALAATKANIMISLNGFIVSALMVSGAFIFSSSPEFLVPAGIFMLTAAAPIVCPPLSAPPRRAGPGGGGAPHAAHLGVDRHLLRGGGLLGRNNREVGASDDDTLKRVEVVPRVDDLRHE